MKTNSEERKVFAVLGASNNSAQAYAWYIWKKGFAGEPTVRWFN